MTFSVLWEFIVKKERQQDFEKVYGPDGHWVQLFRTGKGFISTSLLQDSEQPDRYLIEDRWESETLYLAFLETHQAEYSSLDQRCTALTLKETCLGKYRVK